MIWLLACWSELEPPEHGVVPGETAQVEDTEREDTSVEETPTLYEDLDGDGYGGAVAEDGIKRGGDCDDGDATVNPGAEDVCHDGLDQDCDGVDDCRLQGMLPIEDLAQVRLTAPTKNAYCGVTVVPSPGMTWVGCPSTDDEVAVYLFHGPVLEDRAMESAEGILRPQHPNDKLGLAMAWHGGEMLVSSLLTSNGGVYRVEPFEGELSVDDVPLVPHNVVAESFGRSLAARHDLVAVGANNRGYAYADLSGEPEFWLEGEEGANENVGSQVQVVDVDSDGHSDLVALSRYGVLVVLHGAQGQSEPDIKLVEGTSIGPSPDGLLVAFNEDVCLFSSGSTGTWEPQDADFCVNAPVREDNGTLAYRPMHTELDDGGPDLLFYSKGSYWLYREPEGQLQRHRWAADAVLTGAGPLMPIDDQNGDGLRELAMSDGNEQTKGDVVILGGALP